MPNNFEPDHKIQQIAEAYALDAVDCAAKAFNVKLDWTDDSVANVETILEKLYRSKKASKPTTEQVMMFAKMFGSYIGEVFRRNHGAEWGVVNFGGQKFPGLCASRRDHLFWPWGKVQNRLNNGDEDNVWRYYKALIAE